MDDRVFYEVCVNCGQPYHAHDAATRCGKVARQLALEAWPKVVGPKAMIFNKDIDIIAAAIQQGMERCMLVCLEVHNKDRWGNAKECVEIISALLED